MRATGSLRVRVAAAAVEQAEIVLVAAVVVESIFSTVIRSSCCYSCWCDCCECWGIEFDPVCQASTAAVDTKSTVELERDQGTRR